MYLLLQRKQTREEKKKENSTEARETGTIGNKFFKINTFKIIRYIKYT